MCANDFEIDFVLLCETHSLPIPEPNTRIGTHRSADGFMRSGVSVHRGPDGFRSAFLGDVGRGVKVVRHGVGSVVIALAVLGLSWLLLGGGGGVGSQLEQAEAGGPPAKAAAKKKAPTPPVRSDGDLVDRVMLVGFEGSGPDAAIVGDLAHHHYGGVVIGAANWDGSKADEKLTEKIRASTDGAGLPAPLIAADQEGGGYRTLADLGPEEGEAQIGRSADPDAAEHWAADGGADLARAGINLNLGTVADVATMDGPIADRTFSDDPGLTAVMSAAAVRGCESAGIACAVSHFPGLGGTSQDTDYGPASIALDESTLRKRDLMPFRAAFGAGAPAVVVSHGLYAAYDPVTPASLSRAVTTGLLRKDLGFKGVAISDDLDAGAIRASTHPGAAAVAAINAGIDLVQVGDPAEVGEVRQALITAVRRGEISESRLNEAAARVGLLSRSLGAKK
jgi:beta-N-acetylhexosaminidase